MAMGLFIGPDWKLGEALPDGFSYNSESNDWWMSIGDLRQLVNEVQDDL